MSIPAEVGNLKKLEALILSENRISSLPTSLSKLQSLRDINLAHNKLSIFPTQLAGLKNLDSLNLSHNSLAEIPEGVQHLQCIELNVNQNQVYVTIRIMKLHHMKHEALSILDLVQFIV